MSPALWPILVAVALWLITRLTGEETHFTDGILFFGAVAATGFIIWRNARKQSLNDKARANNEHV